MQGSAGWLLLLLQLELLLNVYFAQTVVKASVSLEAVLSKEHYIWFQDTTHDLLSRWYLGEALVFELILLHLYSQPNLHSIASDINIPNIG